MQVERCQTSILWLAVLVLSAFLACLASPSWAIDESTVFDRMIELYGADSDCEEATRYPGWERRSLLNPKDAYRVRYSRFGCSLGARGALVLFPGRGEGSFEYFETAIDFIERGFSPVYVIDHRGQGLSPRLLDDPHKGHVESFEDYVDDAALFVDAVQKDLSGLGADPKTRLYLTSNSMGGAIAIGLFQRLGPDNPFQAAALLGAMIQINYHSFTNTQQSWLNLRIYSEIGALLQASWRCNISVLWDSGRCENYAVGRAANGYVSGSRRFVDDDQTKMTHSAARYDLRTFMMDEFDWTQIATEEYGSDEFWPGPQLGAATNRWVFETAKFNRKMRKGRNLRKMVFVPVLLVTGTEDLRSYQPYAKWRNRAPDLGRHTRFCDDLNEESLSETNSYICGFVPINGGYHELYKERDFEREQALDTVDWFFELQSTIP